MNPAIPEWMPMPNVGGHQVELYVTSTQIALTTVADLSGFTESYVIIEYIKID
jgi:hypothetical protein